MPMEFMFGRPLSPEELEMLRQQIESMDDIPAINDEELPPREASSSRLHWPR